MKKKVLSVLLAVCLLAGALPISALAAWSTNYTLTGNQAQDIVNVAVAQNGKTGSNLGYSADWCAYFVTDCAKKAGITNFPKQGYASSLFRVMTQWGMEGHYFTDVAAQNSAWTGGKGNGITGFDIQYCTGISSSSWNPRIGDIVFFTYKGYGTISHVAIVRQVSGNKVTLVHGNWSGKVNTSTTLTKGAYQTAGSQTIAICAYVRPGYTASNPDPTATVTTGTASDITEKNVLLHGYAQSEGAAITEVGMHFGTSSNRLYWMCSTPVNSYSYSFSFDSMSHGWGLNPGDTYYYQAYVTVGEKNYFGEIKSFTAASATVSTESARNITDNNAVLTAAASSKGLVIKEIGFYFGTDQNALYWMCSTPVNSYQHSWTINTSAHGWGLNPGTKYYYRAYAISGETRYFGTIKSFTSLNKSNPDESNGADTANDPNPTPDPSDPESPDPTPVPVEPFKPTVAGFSDVFENDYYAKPVQWAVENGITSGTDKTHFSPNKPCTRAQAVTFLWNAFGKPEPQGESVNFADVKAGAYYEKAVQWAVEKGVTSGTGNGKFSPDATCTRAQIVTFLYHAENSPEVSGGNSFGDVKAGAYYEKPVKWAVENGITSGTGNGKFSPENNCVRGQIVTFLYHYKN